MKKDKPIKDTGGNAFPETAFDAKPGMTLRQYYAGQMLPGVLANPDMVNAALDNAKKHESLGHAFEDAIAAAVIRLTDALLKAESK